MIPMMSFKRTDLPTPLGPTTAVVLPGSIVIEMLSSTTCEPNLLWMFLTDIKGYSMKTRVSTLVKK